jgi:hypothetical protein
MSQHQYEEELENLLIQTEEQVKKLQTEKQELLSILLEAAGLLSLSDYGMVPSAIRRLKGQCLYKKDLC